MAVPTIHKRTVLKLTPSNRLEMQPNLPDPDLLFDELDDEERKEERCFEDRLCRDDDLCR